MGERTCEGVTELMAKYKICFSGFAYVEADSEESAIDKYFDDGAIYEESGVDSVSEIDDFIVEVNHD